MPPKKSPWDSARYLRTEEQRAACLSAAPGEAPDDAAFITSALAIVARSRNVSHLARKTGLTREGLYEALSAAGNPSFGTTHMVMRACGVRLAVQKSRASVPRDVKPTSRKSATIAVSCS